jgi:serine/threonine-protein kinase
VLTATMLFLVFVMPPVREALLHQLFPEQNFVKKVESLLSGSSQDRERETAARWFTAMSWIAGFGGVLTLFWLDLPRGIERASRRSRQEEALADKVARRSVRDSLKLYRSALRLAVEPDRITALESRIESLKPISTQVHDSGTVAGRYRSLEVISRGGSGVVYRALDLTLDRPVALKQLATTTIGEDDRARFCQEARVLARLSHPNIVQVYDLIEHDDGLWIAMEFVEGGTLTDHIAAQGRLNPDEVIRLAEGIADAIGFAHEQGIVHRDVKAMNVLLTEDLQPKVADFGTAKLASSSLQTVYGTIIGSPHTMSPEQAHGEPADERSDIYSLGIVMYQMLLGRPPFTGELMAVVMQHIQSPPPAVDQQEDSPEMPGPLAQTVMQMLAKDPDDRFPGMKAVREALSRIPVATEPVDA